MNGSHGVPVCHSDVTSHVSCLVLWVSLTSPQCLTHKYSNASQRRLWIVSHYIPKTQDQHIKVREQEWQEWEGTPWIPVSTRKDLCAVTGTEFEEVVASENDRQTQWLLKTHYKCNSVNAISGQRYAVAIPWTYSNILTYYVNDVCGLWFQNLWYGSSQTYWHIKAFIWFK